MLKSPLLVKISQKARKGHLRSYPILEMSVLGSDPEVPVSELLFELPIQEMLYELVMAHS